MKLRPLSLIILALAISANASAEEKENGDRHFQNQERKIHQENDSERHFFRRDKKDASEEQFSRNDGRDSDSKGKYGKFSEAKKECFSKCVKNTDKVKECRQKHKIRENPEKRGMCISDNQKECVKSCIGAKAEKHYGERRSEKGDKNANDFQNQDRRDHYREARANHHKNAKSSRRDETEE